MYGDELNQNIYITHEPTSFEDISRNVNNAAIFADVNFCRKRLINSKW